MQNSIAQTTLYRTVTYPWELLKRSRKNFLHESKDPRVLWLLASTKSTRFWGNREAFLQSPGCSFSWFLEIADVWKTLWLGRLELNSGLWLTLECLLQETLLRENTKSLSQFPNYFVVELWMDFDRFSNVRHHWWTISLLSYRWIWLVGGIMKGRLLVS